MNSFQEKSVMMAFIHKDATKQLFKIYRLLVVSTLPDKLNLV